MYPALREATSTTTTNGLTTLEMVTIALAYILAMLCIYMSNKPSVGAEDPLSRSAQNMVTYYVTFILSFIAVILAFTNFISIDVMAAASIGFLPAIYSLSGPYYVRNFKLTWNVYQRVYGGTDGVFLFYRVQTRKASLLSPNAAAPSPLRASRPEFGTQLNMFYFRDASRLARFSARFEFFRRACTTPERGTCEQLLTRLLPKNNRECNAHSAEQFWSGQIRERYNEGRLYLKMSYHYGDAWFAIQKILGGYKLLQEPSKVHTESERVVMDGLCALTELVLLGDLCLHFYYKEVLQAYDASMMYERNYGAFMFCYRTLAHLDLLTMKRSVLNGQCLLNFQVERRREAYRKLFFLLTVHSYKFTRVESPLDHVQALLRAGANGQSMGRLKSGVRRWLKCYHFDIEKGISESNASRAKPSCAESLPQHVLGVDDESVLGEVHVDLGRYV